MMGMNVMLINVHRWLPVFEVGDVKMPVLCCAVLCCRSAKCTADDDGRYLKLLVSQSIQ